MATVTYDHVPNATVWAITDCGIISGTVMMVKIHIYELESVPVEEIWYYIQLTDGSLHVADSEDVFDSLSDAAAEYESRLS